MFMEFFDRILAVKVAIRIAVRINANKQFSSPLPRYFHIVQLFHLNFYP